ncbi:MAG: 2Fe-2S iron-sulfur cluster-binding protein [Spiribacter sp.]|nr:2Fe-2S iron-sulfur cluster-binding protein [Spiribacter sp.]
MSQGPYRLAQGGCGITRDQPMAFRYNGHRYGGYAGDTLASALLANGEQLIARSFKYHRPRGIYTIGSEEPGGLLTVGEGARQEPNLKAPTVALHEGLSARSQNCWPSPRWDLMAINGYLSALFVAGFYYKTFMRPASWWEPVYERIIRRAAGLGRLSTAPDPDTYLQADASCDVLVIGGGLAGLEAARAASRSGARVIVAEERDWLGGQLSLTPESVSGEPGDQWVARQVDELEAASNVRVFKSCVAFGLYDHGVVGLVETLAPASHNGQARARYWRVDAQQIVFATGALEQPLAFAGNDLPGVMLAHAACGYAYRFGVAAGHRVVVVGSDDEGIANALRLQRLGVTVAALVDARQAGESALHEQINAAGIPLYAGYLPIRAQGRRRVKALRIAALQGDQSLSKTTHLIGCDAVAVAGGWQPALHLQCHLGGRPAYDQARGIFLPPSLPPGHHHAGACGGFAGIESIARSGRAAGSAAALACGKTPAVKAEALEASASSAPWGPASPWRIIAAAKGGKRFIDLQHDVTVEDVELAYREGYRSVEHLKRYTTLGMGTDQGKIANMLGLHALGMSAGVSPGEAGTTTFRPSYVPITLGAIAGSHRGADFRPARVAPAQRCHVDAGGTLITAGAWHRAQAYPRAGETIADAVNREAAHVRHAVGMVDVSTLGKIALVGPDAPEVVNRLYANGMKTLPPGKARYGLMLREDGLVLDDGTVARLADTRYLLTTTTAHAASVLVHIEYLLETAWPDLRAAVASVSDHWATFAIAGPNSREVLAALFPDEDVSNEAIPFLAVREVIYAGQSMLIMRNSYSGERAYEVYSPADYGEAMWQRALEVGAPYGLAPYGTEAMGVLRIEKGHVAGPELDGRVSAEDIGLGRMTARRKSCVGNTLRDRPGLQDPSRPRLVGLTPIDPKAPMKAGALLAEPGIEGADGLVGHVSSACYSPACERMIGLGFLRFGDERHGEVIEARDPLAGQIMAVQVGPSVFVDPDGSRLHD